MSVDTPDSISQHEADRDLAEALAHDLFGNGGEPVSEQKRYAPGEIKKNRDKLFANGSTFLPVERSEIIGIDNVLEEIDRIIHWLRHSAEYQKDNSRLEPGIILEGEPGTGKTLVSRYIATASEATFINIRDFDHEGSVYTDSDIADLFSRSRGKYAEEKKPVLLFWDEFESAAVNREEAMTPAQATAVSQITAELDGIHGKNEGVLLVGCTNYLLGIDPALRRPGRMGLQIEFHPPDRAGKMMLLDYYLGAYNIEGDLDIETLSYFFDRMSTAADIEEACVEAWRYASERRIKRKASKPVLAQEDLMQVFIKRLVGPPQSFVNLNEEDSQHLAVHESGHAIMASVFGVPLRLITIHPGKRSLGTIMTDDLREHIATHGELIAHMRVNAGSMAAEREAGLEPITGSRGDLEHINRYAGRLVDTLDAGSRTGAYNPRIAGVFRSDDVHEVTPNISQHSIEDADMDIRELIGGVRKDAERTMENIGRDNILAIAEVVVKETTMTGRQFQAALAEVLGTDQFDQFRPVV